MSVWKEALDWRLFFWKEESLGEDSTRWSLVRRRRSGGRCWRICRERVPRPGPISMRLCVLDFFMACAAHDAMAFAGRFESWGAVVKSARWPPMELMLRE